MDERYRLERGGVTLGVLRRGEWDGNQGSWPEWGWLEPLAAAKEALALLAAEARLHDEAVRTEEAGGDPAALFAEADRLQAEFIGPGLLLVSLEDGSQLPVHECHSEGDRILWR